VKAVARRRGIDLVVLFGSVARGRWRSDSDLKVPLTAVGVAKEAPHTRALLQRKLTWLAAYLDKLDQILPGAVVDYAADSTVRRAVERPVQVVIECAVDAGDLLLASERRTVGETTREILEGLHAAGIIDDTLRQRFGYEYAGLRNRIVNDNDELDNAAPWQAARQLVPDGRALLTGLISRLGSSTPPPRLPSPPLVGSFPILWCWGLTCKRANNLSLFSSRGGGIGLRHDKAPERGPIQQVRPCLPLQRSISRERRRSGGEATGGQAPALSGTSHREGEAPRERRTLQKLTAPSSPLTSGEPGVGMAITSKSPLNKQGDGCSAATILGLVSQAVAASGNCKGNVARPGMEPVQRRVEEGVFSGRRSAVSDQVRTGRASPPKRIPG
jgi:uncharacterized protein YutE (UPF0331/DUF86 family)